MRDDQFTKLFKYVEKRFDAIDKKFDEAQADRADIRGAIAELSAQARDYHNESTFIRYYAFPLSQ